MPGRAEVDSDTSEIVQTKKRLEISPGEIEKRMRSEFERLETKINEMSIDEIRRKAKESVSLVDDEVFEQTIKPSKSPPKGQ